MGYFMNSTGEDFVYYRRELFEIVRAVDIHSEGNMEEYGRVDEWTYRLNVYFKNKEKKTSFIFTNKEKRDKMLDDVLNGTSAWIKVDRKDDDLKDIT